MALSSWQAKLAVGVVSLSALIALPQTGWVSSSKPSAEPVSPSRLQHALAEQDTAVSLHQEVFAGSQISISANEIAEPAEEMLALSDAELSDVSAGDFSDVEILKKTLGKYEVSIAGNVASDVTTTVKNSFNNIHGLSAAVFAVNSNVAQTIFATFNINITQIKPSTSN